MEIKKVNEFFKKKNNGVFLIIILIGVMLMLFASDEEKKENNDSYHQAEFVADDEKRLCYILSQIIGVGDVSVMITYDGGIKSDIAYDTNSTIARRGEGENLQPTEESIDRQAVMSSGEPFVSGYLYPNVRGAIIAAEGAGDIEVKQQIQEAASAVLGVGYHKVCVVEKKKK